MSGTNGDGSGTSGVGTGSSPVMPERQVLAIVAAITLGVAAINALTVGDDFAGRLDPWEPWVWELTSAAFWTAAALPLVRITRALRPPRLGWPAGLAALVLLSLPVCALHMGWLAATRGAVYALLGTRYGYDWTWAHTLYEWRKDLLSVLVFAGLGAGSDRWAETLQPPAPPPPPPFRLEIRDGARLHWFAAHEIERVEAAGNYVEVHGPRGPVLHRATLSAVETELAAYGFVRIHRSRLVRRDAVTGLATTPSGDFEATLASGAVVAGSRRFRSGLA